ncbi:MAG: hypothetical protein GY810_10040 [Aureispira sp.]|nr:hypothetical protein [Aureispira sp.]
MDIDKKGLWFIVVLSAILSALCIDDGHNWGGDFALYIEQSKSILAGTTQELCEANKYAMDNSRMMLGPYLYPIGLPFLLSFLYALVGLNFVVLKVVCLCFFIASLPFFYKLFQNRFTNNTAALLVLVAVAWHPSFLTFSDNVLSDFPFLFISSLTLWLLYKQPKLNTQHQVGLAILISIGLLFRSAGLVLIPTLFVAQLVDYFQHQVPKDRGFSKWLQYLIPYIIIVGIMVFMDQLYPRDDSVYIHELLLNLGSTSRWGSIAYYSYYLGKLPISLSNKFLPHTIVLVGSGLVWSLALIAMAIRWKKDLVLLTFFGSVLALHILWPIGFGLRLVFPIVPLFIYFVAQGITIISDKLKIKHSLIILSLLVAVQGVATSIHFYKTSTNEIFEDKNTEIFNYIKTNIAPDKVICFFKPRVLRLLTERNSVFLTNAKKILASEAEYLLDYRYNEVPRDPKNFKKLKKSKDLVLYQIYKD